MKTLIVTIMALALAASTATAAGTSGKNGFFKTPDKKIWCGWGTGSSSFIVCGIKGGFLSPKPARIGMTGKSRAKVIACAGDASPFADPAATKKLRYGKKWKRGPFKCHTEKGVVFCRNKAGHGFFLGVHGYDAF
jgi:hypothetical protein